MNWFEWALIGWLAFGAIATVGMVGRPRDPITPASAAYSVIIAGLLIVGLLWIGGAR